MAGTIKEAATAASVRFIRRYSPFVLFESCLDVVSTRALTGRWRTPSGDELWTPRARPKPPLRVSSRGDVNRGGVTLQCAAVPRREVSVVRGKQYKESRPTT